MGIELEDVSLCVGSFHLSRLFLRVPEGGFGVLMGPNGAGKSMILRAICGLMTPTQGRIRLGGRDVTAWSPMARNVGWAPQRGAIFGRLRVSDQLAFGPRVRGWPRQAVEQRAEELARRLELQALLHRRSAGLSGGERQRVALGRAMAAQPAVLLLDEPFSALAPETRRAMWKVIREYRQEVGATVLMICHDREEAQALGTMRMVLQAGRIVQEKDDGGARVP